MPPDEQIQTMTPTKTGVTTETPDPLAPPKQTEQKPPEGEQKPPEGEKKPEGEQKKEGETKEPVKAAPIVPTDIKLPDGVEVDQGLMTEFTELANKNGWTKEQAQSLVDLQAKALNASSEKGKQAFADLQNQWREKVKADPEIGGTNLVKTQAAIGKFLDTFGDEEARQVMDYTGAGNHPAIVRMLRKAGLVITEGQPVSGAPGGTPQTLAEKLFPIERK
jgi:hypothetical protein